MSDEPLRTVTRVMRAVRTLEGAGFEVRRPFPIPRFEQVDPFLLLDELGPSDLGPGEAKGAPDHPHRGFETVTYLLEGSFEHRDSAGNSGLLAPGDVQWMTAGSGVVHSEMPTRELLEKGGRLHGFQLWVNLPRADKRLRPRYQDIPSTRIPEVRAADGTARVRVIAGEFSGTRAVIETRTPILYLHLTLEPRGRLDVPVPAGFSAAVYVFGGEGFLGDGKAAVADGELALLGPDGDAIRLVAAPGSRLSALVLAGLPLREPVARYGPFVMNTREEILEAMEDFQAGRMGAITVN